ncbi:MAG TPA: HD domain-containing protein [Vicinamibacterales bacterium]
MTNGGGLAEAQAIARAVRDAGGRALIVGGWVRDRLLGRNAKDIDLEVFGLDAGRLKALLERIGPVNTVGESFTVYKVAGLDVSLPRRESKVGRGHRGFEVTGDPSLSIEEAARRRDFTINAIAWDPLTEEYLDPYGGRRDLEARVLRAVDPATFGDDSLRVLRAVQFAARFECRLDEATFALCRSIPLDDLPAERIWGEVEKLLLQAERPSIGLALALDLTVVERLWPELHALVGCPQDPEWHPEGDVWVHTLLVVDGARRRIDDLARPQAVTVMLGALVHDVGKPPTTAFVDGRIRSRGHEAAGVEPATRLLDRLNVHTMDGFDVRRHVLAIVAQHLAPGMWHKAPSPVGDGAFRRLAAKVDLELLARVAEADCHGRTGTFDCSAIDWFRERARALGVEHAPPAPLLMGRHLLALGMKPGPRMGEILRQVYERQLDGEFDTVEGAMAVARTLVDPPA